MKVGSAQFLGSQFQWQTYAVDIGATTLIVPSRSSRVYLLIGVYQGAACAISPNPNVQVTGFVGGGILIGGNFPWYVVTISDSPVLVQAAWYGNSGVDSRVFALEAFEQPTGCFPGEAPETQVLPPAGPGETIAV